jgi:hypothetical protein
VLFLVLVRVLLLALVLVLVLMLVLVLVLVLMLVTSNDVLTLLSDLFNWVCPMRFLRFHVRQMCVWMSGVCGC